MVTLVRRRNLVSNLEFREVAGTTEFIVAEGEARAGLIIAAFIADITAVVVDEGQFAQGLGEVDGAVFTVAVVEGVGSVDDTVVEGVDGLVEGPGTADGVSSSIGEEIEFITHVSTIRSDEDGKDTESPGESLNLFTGVGAEDVKDGETLSNLSEVDTSTEGSLISQFTDTGATGVTFFGA